MKRLAGEALLVWYARRFPIRRGKLRVVDSLWRAAAGPGDTHRVARLAHGGFRMPCDLSEMLQRQFYFFGTYQVEAELLAIWEHEARGAQMVFDVGANAGIFSLAAVGASPDATVHAFEPTPEIAARLRATVALNGLDRLHVHEVAVARENGQASLTRYRGESGANEGMNFIVPGGDAGSERVPTVSLDRFCDDRGIDRIDVMKLDIQGHEHQALAGAARRIGSRRIGMIFTELNWGKQGRQACPATESIRLLQDAGYRFARPARRLDWQQSGAWMRSLTEVIARA